MSLINTPSDAFISKQKVFLSSDMARRLLSGVVSVQVDFRQICLYNFLQTVPSLDALLCRHETFENTCHLTGRTGASAIQLRAPDFSESCLAFSFGFSFIRSILAPALPRNTAGCLQMKGKNGAQARRRSLHGIHPRKKLAVET